MKRTTRLSMITAAALGALAAVPAMATGGQDMPSPGPEMEHRGPMHVYGGPLHMGERGRNLTKEQQDKLFAIMRAQEPQRSEQEKAARTAHEALQALVESDKFDEGKAAALAQTEGKAVAALALLRAKTDVQVLAVLTPEQRKQFQQDGPQRPPRPPARP